MFDNSKILEGFIVLEGLDGSGTTTQKEKLTKHLQQKKLPHYSTSEPTDNSIGKLIRNILAAKEPAERSTLARLFAADRNEHLYGSGGIIGNRAQGRLIICDRYLFSSLAYQGSDLSIEKIWELNKHFPLPEILFFLDISPGDAEERYRLRKDLDIYEKRELHEAVRRNYNIILSELQKSPVHVHCIDATLGAEKIFTELWTVLSSHPIVNPIVKE